MKKPRICLVEPCHCHEEVLFPQIELLRDLFEVHVVAPQSLLDVDLLRETTNLYHAHSFTSNITQERWRRLLHSPWNYLMLWKAVVAIAPDLIVFNSTYTLPEIFITLCLFRRYRKVQIIHDFQKFLKVPGRWMYRAFDGNLVLSEQVHRHITTNHPEFADLDYFLPIFFGSFVSTPEAITHRRTSSKPTLKLGVFGSIQGNRRNYWGLLDTLRDMNRAGAIRGFNVHLVGQATEAVHKYIIENELEYAVRHSTYFVPFRRVFALLSEMDIVLFLIDRKAAGIASYNRYKITATSIWVKGFRKAAAVSSDFVVEDSLIGMCFSYPGMDIRSFLQQIADGRITADDIRAKEQRYEGQSLFSFREQQTRLVNVLRRAMKESPCIYLA